MDLFEYMKKENMKGQSPLARRLRPSCIEEVVGQEHLLGEGKLLYRLIKSDKLGSIILYGPPGTGKTTLAYVIASTTSAEFKELNATTSGKKDIENAVKEAQDASAMYGKKTILFIDEIHRFNKAQQDFLLPFVEDGTVTLIGATTENPLFEVNKALVSRSTLFELLPLKKEDIEKLIRRAVYDEEKGMGSYNAEITDDAVSYLAGCSEGDARPALNAVELAILSTPRNEATGKLIIDTEVAKECIQKRILRYDKEGDNHYDTISAFIKSMRGSDPDACVYYLAKMLAAGEDIKFIARRIMICACEDVGLADPQAIVVATACAQACERIGLPEARIILSEAACYVATAPKSNSVYLAIDEALEAVRDTDGCAVPGHLKNIRVPGSKDADAPGYKYAHDYEEHYVKQQYLPDKLVGTQFYRPGELGHEMYIKERLERLKKREA